MINVEKKEDICVMHIVTDLTKENVKDFEETFDGIISEGFKKVVIHFEKVNFVVSQVLGIIIIKTKKLRENEGNIRIVNNNSYIDRLLSIIGIGKIIDVYETVEESIKEF